jgi:hypothetical protein
MNAAVRQSLSPGLELKEVFGMESRSLFEEVGRETCCRPANFCASSRTSHKSRGAFYRRRANKECLKSLLIKF